MPQLTGHVFLVPDRPMPDLLNQDALGRMEYALAILSTWDFLTDEETDRVEKRLKTWYTLSPKDTVK